MGDFIETLYHRNREALHIVVDEADLFAPQRNLAPESARLLGAMEDLVRRGRARGLGATLITQRPAVLHKDVLSQASVLVAMRMTGKHDVAAIDEWVRLHADEDEAKTMKSSLPSLPVGTAWFWSPGWLGVLEQVQVRRRHSFDSSATPKVGEARRLPEKVAQIDLTAIGDKIAAAAETAQANDPKALHAKVARLERELASRPASVQSDPVVQIETVTEHVLDPAFAAAVEVLAGDVRDALTAIAALDEQARSLQAAIRRGPAQPVKAQARRTAAARHQRAAAQPAPQPQLVPPDDVVRLKAGARRLIETLARQHPQRLTKAQLATLAKFRVTGGTFGTYWGQVRRLGFVDERGTGRDADYTLTDSGFAFLGQTAPTAPLTGREVIDSYSDVLKAGARAMLETLVDAWPEDLSRSDLAAAVGMAESGGTFGTYLGTLRRNGLVIAAGQEVRLVDHLGETL